MKLNSYDTPSPIVISLNHVVITTKHGTYPVHRGWFHLTPQRIESKYKLNANTAYLASIAASDRPR